MHKQFIVLACALAVISVGEPGRTDNRICQRLTVTAWDGYVNVRSEPEVQSEIVGVLPSGSEVEPARKSGGWYQVDSPIAGWLAGNQVETISCESARDILAAVGHPAIEEFGRRAAGGDTAAANTLAKMAPGVDGVTAEVYAEAIALWANENPSFLIQVLDQQDLTTRYRVLYALDFGLGRENSPERQQFESVISQQAPNNPTALAWQRVSGR